MFRLTCCEETTGFGGLDNCPETCIIGSMMNDKESLMKNEPTYQELVNLVEFLSHRLQTLDQFERLDLNERENELIAFCADNRNYGDLYDDC